MSVDWYEFRGFDRERVQAARAAFLGYFPDGGRILDVGAGRGEFLSAASEAGFRAEGLDSDRKAVAAAVESGLRVVHADAHDFLLTHPGEFDGVFCSHLIEHLSPTGAKRLIAAVAKALTPEGVLCVVTPNPGSMATITHEFWRDPSHVRPYDLEALEFLCISVGLEIVDSGRNPDSELGLPIDPDDLRLNALEPEPDRPPAGQSRLAGWVANQFRESRMARELQAVIHRQRMQIERLEQNVALLSNSVRRLVEVLYEPSEVFVVARKP
ncbi:MAG: class I SAM-dependent methyltransferase [Chloroflexi bacterium]|nr:class I SAM-dependent methyltransferase [Chloroflexota bacterium]